jgi:hypothetical protein
MLTELSALLDLLKTKGVTRYSGPLSTEKMSQPQVVIHFAPVEPQLPKDEKSKPNELEVCRCGCPLFVHTNGLCGNGCEVEQCAPPEKE